MLFIMYNYMQIFANQLHFNCTAKCSYIYRALTINNLNIERVWKSLNLFTSNDGFTTRLKSNIV